MCTMGSVENYCDTLWVSLSLKSNFHEHQKIEINSLPIIVSPKCDRLWHFGSYGGPGRNLGFYIF